MSTSAMDHMVEKLPPSALEHQRKQVNGISMERLSIKRETAMESARMAGFDPFTIWNFNPVILDVCCAHVNFKPAPYNHPAAKQKTIQFGTKSRVASELVVSNFDGYSRPTDAKNEAGDPNNPDVKYEWHVVLPIEQARLFEFQYNNPGAPESMGGILVFKGDGHIKGGKDQIIEIPQTKRLRDGSLTYYTEPVSFVEKLNEVLMRQKNYCMQALRQAEDWSRRDNLKDSIHNVHAAWGQFAADMGWQDIGRLHWLLPRDADEGCKKCGKMREGKAMFCQCGHPYDAYEAFMAGMKVDLETLATLPPKQLEEVQAVMKQRRALFADAVPPAPAKQ